jgi:hypothetical protein
LTFPIIGFPNNWHIAFPNALLAHPNKKPNRPFNQLQMAMKLHRLGLDTSKYLEELCEFWSKVGLTGRESEGYKKICAARIVNGNFYLPTEQLLLLTL